MAAICTAPLRSPLQEGGLAWWVVLQHRQAKWSPRIQVELRPGVRPLRYQLTCIVQPKAFNEQLELVEQLQSSMTPQLRLEYAILLFQNSRPVEADKVFDDLRRLWKNSEYFVHGPNRLRWLWAHDGDTLRTVRATTASDSSVGPPRARVSDFRDALVPFRPEEYGVRHVRPGMRLTCHVSFGHNGPFLRPATAHP